MEFSALTWLLTPWSVDLPCYFTHTRATLTRRPENDMQRQQNLLAREHINTSRFSVEPSAHVSNSSRLAITCCWRLWLRRGWRSAPDGARHTSGAECIKVEDANAGHKGCVTTRIPGKTTFQRGSDHARPE